MVASVKVARIVQVVVVLILLHRLDLVSSTHMAQDNLYALEPQVLRLGRSSNISLVHVEDLKSFQFLARVLRAKLFRHLWVLATSVSIVGYLLRAARLIDHGKPVDPRLARCIQCPTAIHLATHVMMNM